MTLQAPVQRPFQQPQPRVPAFLNKLYAYVPLLPPLFTPLPPFPPHRLANLGYRCDRLLNDPETDEYVRWNDAGTAFVIPNAQLMAENVLPRSFKTINFASFVRQLNSTRTLLSAMLLTSSVRLPQSTPFK